MITRVNDSAGDLRESPNQFNPHCLLDGLSPSFGSVLQNLWVFTFVRNPWERYVSWYTYQRSCDDFDAFLWKLLQRATPTSLPTQDVYFADPSVYNFVGKLETIEQDWQKVKEQLNISGSLPELNVSNHRHYSTYYTSALKDSVAACDRYVIEQFGYEFQKIQLK